MILLKIRNVEEKQLLVAGYFIRQRDNGISFQESDIFEQWNKYFPRDFHLWGKKYRNQRFIYGEETEYGCLTLPDKRYIRKYVIERYNKLWTPCCIAIKDYIERFTRDDWEREITILRKKHERQLKMIVANLGGCVQINHWRIERLSTYHIWLDEGEFIGNYRLCMNYLEEVKRERRYRDRYW